MSHAALKVIMKHDICMAEMKNMTMIGGDTSFLYFCGYSQYGCLTLSPLVAPLVCLIQYFTSALRTFICIRMRCLKQRSVQSDLE